MKINSASQQNLSHARQQTSPQKTGQSPITKNKFMYLQESLIFGFFSKSWIINENVPGLAISRSFGDYVAAQVGVISIPEIMNHILQNDKFLIIASDGIWEFLDNQWLQIQYTVII